MGCENQRRQPLVSPLPDRSGRRTFTPANAREPVYTLHKMHILHPRVRLPQACVSIRIYFCIYIYIHIHRYVNARAKKGVQVESASD